MATESPSLQAADRKSKKTRTQHMAASCSMPFTHAAGTQRNKAGLPLPKAGRQAREGTARQGKGECVRTSAQGSGHIQQHAMPCPTHSLAHAEGLVHQAPVLLD